MTTSPRAPPSKTPLGNATPFFLVETWDLETKRSEAISSFLFSTTSLSQDGYFFSPFPSVFYPSIFSFMASCHRSIPPRKRSDNASVLVPDQTGGSVSFFVHGSRVFLTLSPQPWIITSLLRGGSKIWKEGFPEPTVGSGVNLDLSGSRASSRTRSERRNLRWRSSLHAPSLPCREGVGRREKPVVRHERTLDGRRGSDP